MSMDNGVDFIADIKRIIEQARGEVYTSINAVMIKSHWLIGRRIV